MCPCFPTLRCFLTHLGTPRDREYRVRSRSMVFGTLRKSFVNQIQTWTSKCLEDHSTCCNSWVLASEKRKLPTRLLEVSNDSGNLNVRVISTDQLELSSSYLTLSHCWGSKKFATLTTMSYDAFSQSIPLDDLSRNFRDAIELTLLLECPYIWIDSPCIIQDSNEDWVRESSAMGEIYSHALLNIAATAASDGNGGLFHRNNSLSSQPYIIRMQDEHKTDFDFVCYPLNIWVNQVDDTPLGKRSWVVQERILSPRVVHFASDQLFWECCEEKYAELLPRN
jgi:hypothetical protein